MNLNEAKKELIKHGYIIESVVSKENANILYTLAFNTLLMADRVHTWHWSCDSGFQHTHLQEIYEGLRDFADELVEMTLASGEKFNYTLDREKIDFDEKFNIIKAIKTLEDYNTDLQKLIENDTFGNMKDIENCITDAISLLSKEIGLLKNFR